MRKWLLTVVLMAPVAGICDITSWQPPENPDPSEILREARADRDAGRYQLALDKHVWYHDNALKHDPGHGGVRLSFALSDWRQLANRYPPALEKMMEFRDRAELWVKRNKEDFAAFHDFVRLNTQLKDDERTVYLFRWLHEYDPAFAKSAYSVAQDILVAEGELELCGKYIEGIESFKDDLQMYRRSWERAEKRYDPEKAANFIESQQGYFANQTGYVVAILVRIGRSGEATEIASLAISALEDDAHKRQILAAQEGNFPDRIQ